MIQEIKQPIKKEQFRHRMLQKEVKTLLNRKYQNTGRHRTNIKIPTGGHTETTQTA